MDKELIENCYRRMYKGMIDKDREVLDGVLDDSFILIHMTGMRQSKDEFIKAVENGTLNYYSADHQSIESQIKGNTMILIGKSVVDASVFGGDRNTWRLRLDLKLIKKANVWRVIEARASAY